MPAQNIQKTAPISITRPANVTQYAAGDVINGNGSTAILQIKLNVSDNFNAWLIGGQAITSVSQSSLSFDALFFSADVGPLAADNDPFNPSDGNLLNFYLGRVSFSSFRALNSNAIADGITASTKPIVVTPNGNTLYVVLIATSTYTPTASEVLTVKFDFEEIGR